MKKLLTKIISLVIIFSLLFSTSPFIYTTYGKCDSDDTECKQKKAAKKSCSSADDVGACRNTKTEAQRQLGEEQARRQAQMHPVATEETDPEAAGDNAWTSCASTCDTNDKGCYDQCRGRAQEAYLEVEKDHPVDPFTKQQHVVRDTLRDTALKTSIEQSKTLTQEQAERIRQESDLAATPVLKDEHQDNFMRAMTQKFNRTFTQAELKQFTQTNEFKTFAGEYYSQNQNQFRLNVDKEANLAQMGKDLLNRAAVSEEIEARKTEAAPPQQPQGPTTEEIQKMVRQEVVASSTCKSGYPVAQVTGAGESSGWYDCKSGNKISTQEASLLKKQRELALIKEQKIEEQRVFNTYDFAPPATVASPEQIEAMGSYLSALSGALQATSEERGIPTDLPTGIQEKIKKDQNLLTSGLISEQEFNRRYNQTIYEYKSIASRPVMENPTVVLEQMAQISQTLEARTLPSLDKGSATVLALQMAGQGLSSEDGDTIPDVYEEFAARNGYNLDPNQENRITYEKAIGGVRGGGMETLTDQTYTQLLAAAKQAGLYDATTGWKDPSLLTANDIKYLQRQLQYQKDPFKFLQLGIPLVTAAGPDLVGGFAYPEYRQMEWAKADAIEALQPYGIQFTKGITQYTDEEFSFLVEQMEHRGATLPPASFADIQAYRSAYFEAQRELTTCGSGKRESIAAEEACRRELERKLGGRTLEEASIEGAQLRTGWDFNRLNAAKNSLAAIDKYSASITTPEIAALSQNYLDKSQEFAGAQIMNITFDLLLGPISGLVKAGFVDDILGDIVKLTPLDEAATEALEIAGRATSKEAGQISANLLDPGVVSGALPRVLVPAEANAADIARLAARTAEESGLSLPQRIFAGAQDTIDNLGDRLSGIRDRIPGLARQTEEIPVVEDTTLLGKIWQPPIGTEIIEPPLPGSGMPSEYLYEGAKAVQRGDTDEAIVKLYAVHHSQAISEGGGTWMISPENSILNENNLRTAFYQKLGIADSPDLHLFYGTRNIQDVEEFGLRASGVTNQGQTGIGSGLYTTSFPQYAMEYAGVGVKPMGQYSDEGSALVHITIPELQSEIPTVNARELFEYSLKETEEQFPYLQYQSREAVLQELVDNHEVRAFYTNFYDGEIARLTNDAPIVHLNVGDETTVGTPYVGAFDEILIRNPSVLQNAKMTVYNPYTLAFHPSEIKPLNIAVGVNAESFTDINRVPLSGLSEVIHPALSLPQRTAQTINEIAGGLLSAPRSVTDAILAQDLPGRAARTINNFTASLVPGRATREIENLDTVIARLESDSVIVDEMKVWKRVFGSQGRGQMISPKYVAGAMNEVQNLADNPAARALIAHRGLEEAGKYSKLYAFYDPDIGTTNLALEYGGEVLRFTTGGGVESTTLGDLARLSLPPPLPQRAAQRINNIVNNLPLIGKKEIPVLDVNIGGSPTSLTVDSIKVMPEDELQATFRAVLESNPSEETLLKLRKFFTEANDVTNLDLNLVVGNDLELEYWNLVAARYPGKPDEELFRALDSRMKDLFAELDFADYDALARSFPSKDNLVFVSQDGWKKFLPRVAQMQTSNKIFIPEISTNPIRRSLGKITSVFVPEREIGTFHEMFHWRTSQLGIQPNELGLTEFFEGVAEYGTHELFYWSKARLARDISIIAPISRGTDYTYNKIAIGGIMYQLERQGFNGKQMIMDFYFSGDVQPIIDAIGIEGIKGVYSRLPSPRLRTLPFVTFITYVNALFWGRSIQRSLKEHKSPEPVTPEPEGLIINPVLAAESNKTIPIHPFIYKKVSMIEELGQMIEENPSLTPDEALAVIDKYQEIAPKLEIDGNLAKITTGEGGFAQYQLSAGLYQLNIDSPIENLDVIQPAANVSLRASTGTDIEIGLREGRGRILTAEQPQEIASGSFFDRLRHLLPQLAEGVRAEDQQQGASIEEILGQKTFGELLEEVETSEKPEEATTEGVPQEPEETESLPPLLTPQPREPQTQGTVTLSLYHDANANGQRDEGEEDLPWAGMTITLEKKTEAITYELREGWNLVAFPVVPESFTTAAELVTDVARQGGYITSVARWVDGRWEAYIQRGDQPYGQDFLLQPGVGYMLRGHLPITWTASGFQITSAIPLNLKKGYNLVGVVSPSSSTAIRTIDKINTTANEEVARTVTRFESGLYEPLVKRANEIYGEDYPMEKTRGYFIRVEKDVQWTP